MPSNSLLDTIVGQIATKSAPSFDNTSYEPTPEQSHILSLAASGNSNLMINAYAGTGKTATLEMIERAVTTTPILYLVFNKRNQQEAEQRMLSTTRCKTLNGLGHGIWAQAVAKRKLSIPKNKCADILRGIINEAPKKEKDILWDAFWEVLDGVGMAKALGYVPIGAPAHVKSLCTQSDFHARLDQKPDDLVSDLIDAVLRISIKQAYDGLIDFNDQLYMPALFGGTYPRYPLVMVDEAQDLSPINHAMLNKLCKHSRVIAVGDPFQSIYGFRGAVQSGMQILRERFNMVESSLSVSFRCPEAIVLNARWRVPEFKFFKSGGHVEVLKTLSFADIPEGATILCRNNAPLFKLALRLLVGKRSVEVAGAEIGPKLIATMKKMGPDDMSQASLLSAIDDWLNEKLAKGSTSAADMAECMKAFAEFGATLSQAIIYAEHLFAQQGSIKLMTGHKAKGLEWNHVIHIDPWLIGVDEQELNLRYVIQTRSKDKYFEVDSAMVMA